MAVLLETARLRLLASLGAVGALAVEVVAGPAAMIAGASLLALGFAARGHEGDVGARRKRAAQFGAAEIVCALFLSYYAAANPLVFRFVGLGAVVDRVMHRVALAPINGAGGATRPPG
jgi:hypothetical protein